MNFEAFAEDIRRNGWNVFGAEVYRDQQLIHRFGDCTQTLHPIYSATKTVLSVAMGIAWDRGLVDFDRCVLTYLPAENVRKMTQHQRDDFEPVSLHRLMTMSVKGFPFRAEGDSFLDFSLACPLEHPETPAFDYSNISAYLAGVALTGALGEDASAWIEREVLAPLGIDAYQLGRCPEGYFYGASNMELTVNGLSRIGLMLANGGVYEGRRILSESYVSKATAVQQMNREGGYGYFLWKYRDGFSINGKWKQKCYVLPNEGLVITYLAHIEEDCPELKASMERHLLGICAE